MAVEIPIEFGYDFLIVLWTRKCAGKPTRG